MPKKDPSPHIKRSETRLAKSTANRVSSLQTRSQSRADCRPTRGGKWPLYLNAGQWNCFQLRCQKPSADTGHERRHFQKVLFLDEPLSSVLRYC